MPEILKSLLSSQTNLLWVGLISAVVSAGVSYLFRKWETRDRLETEYEYEQRKKLRDLIGLYHGRLLNAADSMNYRLFDLYENHEKGWLTRRKYNAMSDYFHSSVYRFMNVCSLIRQFEREALYVDGRIAEKTDFLFVKYLNALRWCITDASLFDGLPVANYYDTHHFHADTFRQYCDSCINDKGEFIGYDLFIEEVDGVGQPERVLEFFDSLSKCGKAQPKWGKAPTEYKWDRLVAFHLILAGLINAFGYPEQEISEEQIRLISSQFMHMEVLMKLRDWLPKRGLAEESLTKTITQLVPTVCFGEIRER